METSSALGANTSRMEMSSKTQRYVITLLIFGKGDISKSLLIISSQYKELILTIRFIGMELISSHTMRLEETSVLKLRKFMETTTITMSLEDSNEWATK